MTGGTKPTRRITLPWLCLLCILIGTFAAALPSPARAQTPARGTATPPAARGPAGPTSRPTAHGYVGLGTYNTVVQFKDLAVTAPDGKEMFKLDPSKGLSDWYFNGGQWKFVDDLFKQSALEKDCRATIGDAAWTDYSVSVKARKITGDEGFAVIFRVHDASNYCWFNVGGWKNSKAQMETCIAGTRTAIGTSTPITIESDRWYDAKVEIKGEIAKCYVDGKLLSEADISEVPPPTAAAGAQARGGNTGGAGAGAAGRGDTAPQPTLRGYIGVGTYATQVQFKDIVVNSAANTPLLAAADFSQHGLEGWNLASGQWKVTDAALTQSSDTQGARATIGQVDWTDYTLSLKARKASGKEGFLVLFRVRDNNNYAWFNVGGWNNTKAQVELTTNGNRTAIGDSTAISVQPNRWYDINVEVKGETATCSVDGQVMCRSDLFNAPATRPAQGAVAAGRGTSAATQPAATQAAATQPSNNDRQNAIRDQLSSKNSTKITQAFAALKAWYGTDPVNAEHAFWQLRALFPPLTDHVSQTQEMIQLAWKTKNSPSGDHSDPGYLYAMEASCLLQQHQVQQAVAKIQEGLKVDPVHASEEFMSYISAAAPPKEADSALVELLPAIVAGKPDDSNVVEPALKLRIALLDAAGRYGDAVTDAKSFFNISAMRHTSEALALLDKQLQLAHPDDASIDAQFRQQELDGAGTPDGPAKTSPAIANIMPNSPQYDQALSKLKGTTAQDQLRQAALLLVTGDPNKALPLAQQALRYAQNNNERNAANEFIARCYKAQDGTIGRANAYVELLRENTKADNAPAAQPAQDLP